MMSPEYLALLLSLPAAISATVGVAFWRRRKSSLETLLALLMFSSVFWSLGYSLEVASSTPAFFWLWGVIQYIGIACTPTLFFVLMIHYAGGKAWLTRPIVGALSAIPAFTVAFRIAEPHLTLIHRSTEIRRAGAFVFQVHTPGPWFWLVIVYSYVLLWGGLAILLYFRSTARLIHRRHMTLLCLGALAPLAGSLAYITGHRPFGYIDLTPSGFTFVGLTAAWGALRHRVLQVMPVARTALVDSFPDGLLMLDRRGRLLDMNVTAARMLRLENAVSLGKSTEEVLKEWPVLLGLCRSETEGRVEFEIDRNDPRHAVRYIEARLTFLHQHLEETSACLVVLTDITDRRRAEDLLGKSEALYHDLVETAQDLIWQCSGDGKFTYLNPAWENALGLDVAGLIGKRFADFQIPETGKTDVSVFSQITHDSSPREYETTLAGQNGRQIHLIVKGKCVYDANGTITGARGTAHDITARKRVEAQLLQAMKMEAVGQLAGGIAHDFNNLLQAINGNTEMALHEIPVEHPAHSYLEEIAKGGARATVLVQQILAFSRRQVIRPEPLNMNDVVAALLSILHRVIGEHIRIDFVSGLLLGTICVDRGQLEQILMNLSVNARDAMPEGGMVRIETANVTLDEAYCADHPEAKPGPYVMLSIADNGVGMDAATLEHLWEPFFTTKPTGKGTGMGLSTVYGIVTQHGGAIDVTSRPGEGATFKIYFPRQQAMPPRSKAPVKVKPPSGHETILLAEDEESVRTLARRILEHAGYTVLVAENGQEAVDLAGIHGEKIDLALLDVVMPILGGRAAYEHIRSLCPRMRFIFISGYNVDMVNASFVLDDGMELIQKPFDRVLLLNKVREKLDT